MAPRRARRGPQTPLERAATAEAAKGFELTDEGPGSPDARVAPGSDALDPTLTGALRLRSTHDLAPDDAPLRVAERDGLVDVLDAEPALPATDEPTSQWRQMLEVFLQNKLAVASVVVLVIIVLGVYLGPFFYSTNQTNTNLIIQNGTKNLAPNSTNWLGTDGTGWDELGRIMYGGQYSLSLGFFAGLITIILGTAYGMIAGFFGGFLDSAMMRVIDAALSIPYLFLLVALVTIFGNTTTFLLLVIGLTGWWGNSRIIRGDALVIRDLEYSIAAISMGARKAHVIRRHVFPNSISNIVTVGTFSIADAILALSALGFIGIGVQSPAVDWGFMMFQGTNVLIDGYWWEIYPVATVFVTVILCINYIGDALRDIFEVRLRQR